jgi:hypothetical protein
MLVFTQQLEPLVWRGYQSSGVDAMQRVLQLWETNQQNPDEEFWQRVFDDYLRLVSGTAAPDRRRPGEGLCRGQDR